MTFWNKTENVGNFRNFHYLNRDMKKLRTFSKDDCKKKYIEL